jgi:hypothetical protein
VLWNPTTPSHARALQSVETAAEKLGLTLQMVPARSLEDSDGAFATMAQERVGGDASQVGHNMPIASVMPVAGAASRWSYKPDITGFPLLFFGKTCGGYRARQSSLPIYARERWKGSPSCLRASL